jgi:hypothetical protein|tara:strand:+ start:953 stop:1189 length:237 start_codon:yes stop_codon:yes gene_type:complete
MWEMILFTVAGFLGGWGLRGFFDRWIVSTQQAGDPEMMWFNTQTFQWERVTEDSLVTPSDRVVVAIPVKLEERNDVMG